MAQLIVSMNLSMDGYIEAQGQDEGSWLRIDEAVHRAFNELAASAEAFLYGRKVYEVMIPYWPDVVEDATKPAHERDYGRIWVDKTKVVFSTSLTETRWNTRVVPSGARAEVLRLKNESKGVRALGAGVPFFRRRVDLKLVGVRRFDTGVLALRYSTLVA